ncbi:MAG: S8 family peptidase, partial [Clostridia bacterium]|nr:S8 family peptidase [Clostridia bacterium]
MKKFLALLLVLALVFSLTPAVMAQNSTQRVIVTFKHSVDRTMIQRARGQIKQEFRNTPSIAVTVPASSVSALRSSPDVLAVETDQIVKISSQFQDWGVTCTDAPKAWANGFTGKGVKVAVLDTGIAPHEDLTVAGGVSLQSYTSSYADDNGHGTHVAGIIGARNNSLGVVGIAPEASLYAVKVLDQDGSGYMSDIISGIEWCISNKMDIINLSLGSSTSSFALKAEVDKAYGQGILIVAAAGNEGTTDGTGDSVNYPARYDSVIAVAAVDSTTKRAAFSSTGRTVEVAAPGVNIASTYPGDAYARMSGTSMATPFVSGDLALLKQAYPSLTNVQLRDKLDKSAVDLGTTGRDAWYGYGLIQAPLTVSSGADTPTLSQPKSLETRTTLTAYKMPYIGGRVAYIKARVTDSNGTPLQAAQVKMTLTTPAGKVAVYDGFTDSSGQMTVMYPI